jgi:hypothetical protein
MPSHHAGSSRSSLRNLEAHHHDTPSCLITALPPHDAVTPQDSSGCCPEGPYYAPPPTAPICSRRARPWPRPRTRRRTHGGMSNAFPLAITGAGVLEMVSWGVENELTQLAYSGASGSLWQRSPPRGRYTLCRATTATTRNHSSPA